MGIMNPQDDEAAYAAKGYGDIANMMARSRRMASGEEPIDFENMQNMMNCMEMMVGGGRDGAR